jgi:menaquinone-specific isochorismate synthase
MSHASPSPADKFCVAVGEAEYHALERRVDQALAFARARGGRALLSGVVGLGDGCPELLDLVADTERAGQGVVFWETPGGERWLGFGAALRLWADGGDRFGDLARRTAAVADLVPDGGLDPGAIRLAGGLAFSEGAARVATPWTAFGSGFFTLPALVVLVVGGRASLTLHRVVEASEQAGAVLASEWSRLLAALRWMGSALPRACGLPAVRGETSQTGSSQWVDAVRAATDVLRSPAPPFSKVVLARSSRFRASSRPAIAGVLHRLRERAPECTRFCIEGPVEARRGQDAPMFFGATPERLVALEGRHLRTDALAGTAPVEATADWLLGDPKNQREHDLVVGAIREALAPVVSALRVPAAPVAHRLRDLFHLRTPIEGTLRGGAHILEIAGRLHPTPAVCGLPQQAARQWIASVEAQLGLDRGWYSGPVGWVTPSGDGELMVGLRSALAVGSLVWLFAGAGIVDASDPEAELAETELKLRAIRGALEGGE